MQFDLFDQAQNRILSAPTYADFRQALSASNCTRCSLSASRAQIVVDRGNPAAKILLIGEAPGAEEDKQGRPFVGRAGQLLDTLMQAIGVDTNRDFLIANIAKCRPPENRTPRPEESEACFPYLRKQIELMKPKLIILLGATAVKPFLPEAAKQSGMEDLVGKFYQSPRYPGMQFLILYHTAFILRDPRKRPDMERHLLVLKKYLAGAPPAPPGPPSSARGAGAQG